MTAVVGEHGIDIMSSEDTRDDWTIDTFTEKLKIKVIEQKQDPENVLLKTLEFDIIGIDPPLVNTLRRILISEVPTVAIEKVHVYNNTTIFQDEFLAHRLGLIPIRVDPRQFQFDAPGIDDSKKFLHFELKVKCGKGKVDGNDFNRVDKCVFSSHIKWLPIPGQEHLHDDPPEPVNSDILIAKLSPGQELDLKLVCVKGIGQDHTKFSPVATASYRFLPKITLKRNITGSDAKLLKECFSEGVIDIVKGKAVVKDARKDLCSRNVLRYDNLKDSVLMEMVEDHVIFTIETTGALTPRELMCEAIDVLIMKCDKFLTEVKKLK